MEPLSKKPKLELNKFLFDVVNQFSLDEFERYTNFPDVMVTILKDKSDVKDLERYIQRNFQKNIPNEESWIRGGFRSLKLTPEFYESDAAARIFEKLFGLKKCTVTLDTLFQFAPKIILKKCNVTNLWDVQHAGYVPPKKSDSNGDNQITWRFNYPSKVGINSPKSSGYRRLSTSSEPSVQYPKSSLDIDVNMNFQHNNNRIGTSRRTELMHENGLLRLPFKQPNFIGAETRKNQSPSHYSRYSIHTFEQLSNITKDTTANQRSFNQGNTKRKTPHSEASRSSKAKFGTNSKQEQVIQSNRTLTDNHVQKPKNFSQTSPGNASELITVSIPFEIIKVHMTESELQDYFRGSFVHELKHVENEFEKYITSTEPTNLSLNDFWHTFFTSKIRNDQKDTQPRNGTVHTFGGSINCTETNFELDRPHHFNEIKIKRETISDDVNEHTSVISDNTEEISANPQPHHNEKSSLASFAKPFQSADGWRKEPSTAGCSNGFLSTIPQNMDNASVYQPVNIQTEVNLPTNKRRSSAESCVSQYQQEFCNFLKSAPSESRRKTS